MSNQTRHFRIGLSRAWRRRVTGVLDGLYQAVTLPLRLLFGSSFLLDAFHYHGVNSGHSDRRTVRGLLRRLLSLPLQLALLPTVMIRRIWRRKRQQELLYLLPASIVILLFAFVGYRVLVRKGSIERRYIAGAVEAFDSHDWQLCKRYLLRTMNPNHMSAAETLSWASMLRLNGETEKADKLLLQVAPVNAAGYAPAHRVTAVSMGLVFERTGTVDDLNSFRWHLTHADREDPALDRAWASYYRASGRPDQAIRYLLRAGQLHPELFLLAAELAKQTGQALEEQNAIGAADRIYTRQVLDRPFDIHARIRLADTRIRQGRIDDAEKIVMEGLKIEPNPNLRRIRSGLYVLRFENQINSLAAGVVDVTALVWLERAINIDPENPVPISKMTDLLANLPQDQRDLLNAELFNRITGNHTNALDYFLLAHQDWQAGNVADAQSHLDHAWRLDPNFSKLGYRLALAAADERVNDLDWALVLAKRSVERSPELRDARSALGTIYLRQNQPRLAVDWLTAAVDDSQHQPGLQQQLALAYQQLGLAETARQHSDRGGD